MNQKQPENRFEGFKTRLKRSATLVSNLGDSEWWDESKVLKLAGLLAALGVGGIAGRVGGVAAGNREGITATIQGVALEDGKNEDLKEQAISWASRSISGMEGLIAAREQLDQIIAQAKNRHQEHEEEWQAAFTGNDRETLKTSSSKSDEQLETTQQFRNR